VSTSSESSITSLANIKASITIQDGTKKNNLNYVEVKLSDGKKQISNENIKVLLNNSPLELFVRTGNYYDKHSYYGSKDLSRKESYYFEIILPDGTRSPLAFIKPINKNKIASFSFPKHVSLDNDFILKWENLTTPHQLNINTGVEVKKKRAKNITENEYNVIPTATLKQREGEYIVPKSFFLDSLTTAKYLTINLTRIDNGLINPSLQNTSNISYHYVVERTISFEEKN
jgi:hypothetical protein